MIEHAAHLQAIRAAASIRGDVRPFEHPAAADWPWLIDPGSRAG